MRWRSITVRGCCSRGTTSARPTSPMTPDRSHLPPSPAVLNSRQRNHRGNGQDMISLAGKIAWVTGAGSGIGEAAALALSDAGATVVLTGRRREPLEDVARRINTKGAAHVQ